MNWKAETYLANLKVVFPHNKLCHVNDLHVIDYLIVFGRFETLCPQTRHCHAAKFTPNIENVKKRFCDNISNGFAY